MVSHEDFKLLVAAMERKHLFREPSLTCPQHSPHHFRGHGFGQNGLFDGKMARDHHLESARGRNSKSFSFTNLHRDYPDAECFGANHHQNEPRAVSASPLAFPTPPATASCSQSTLFNWPYCNSPSFSDDSHFTSYRNPSSYLHEHYYDVSPAREYAELMKGCYTKEGVGVVYGQENIYTAEAVHGFVKNRRDVSKPRRVSNKVFVGGISHSMNRETINTFFARFGTVFVDWPVKGPRTNARGAPIPMASYSYLFLVYQDEQSVLSLMAECKNPSENEYFVNVPGCPDTIQIRPWVIEHGFYVAEKARDEPLIDIHRTVFVGGLPRIVTADEIRHMFSKFGAVLLVTIDIDQDYAYPKGAARVVFERDSAFNRALETKYLKFENIDSSKTTIEIKPYVMEDIGCDECGGLWFNPFLEIYDQLRAAEKQRNERNVERNAVRSASLLPIWTSSSSSATSTPSESAEFNMWSCTTPFSIGSFTPTKRNNEAREKVLAEPAAELAEPSEDVEHDEVVAGARKLLAAASKFPIGEQQTQVYDGKELRVGPELWNYVLKRQTAFEPMHMHMEKQIETYLCLKRGNVYSNKSSYCKEKPCRQYYCPSCSNRLHNSRARQHLLLPAGRPERRPRKDKNMYMVQQH